MNATVTGAGGFCGRALCQLLLSQGLQVNPLHRTDFGATGHSLPSAEILAGHFSRHPPDYVFHLAGISHTEDPISLYSANVLSAVALLEGLTKAKLQPVVVLVGSAAEYGPVTRDDLPIRENRGENPVDAYGLSKLLQTRVGKLASAQGLRVVLSRPFNIIGAGMPRRLALGNFLDQIAQLRLKSGGKLITGNLAASRDFVTVQDAARAWWELASRVHCYGEVINLCSGTPVRLQSIVGWLVSSLPFPLEVECRSSTCSNDYSEHFGSAARLEQLLGWKPSPVTAESIRQILDEHLSQYANSDSHHTRI